MNRSALPPGRSSWLTGGRFAARERVRRQFDLQYLQAMQIKMTAVAVLAGDGELEAVAANQPRHAAAVAPDAHGAERHTVVQQLHVSALAVRAHTP